MPSVPTRPRNGSSGRSTMPAKRGWSDRSCDTISPARQSLHRKTEMPPALTMEVRAGSRRRKRNELLQRHLSGGPIRPGQAGLHVPQRPGQQRGAVLARYPDHWERPGPFEKKSIRKKEAGKNHSTMPIPSFLLFVGVIY